MAARSAVWDGGSGSEVVIAESIAGESFYGGEEATLQARLVFSEKQRVDDMPSEIVVIREGKVAQPVFIFHFGTIGLPLCPHPCGEILGFLGGVVRIGTKSFQCQVLAESERELYVCVEVE